MTSTTVGNSVVKFAAAGNRDFFHICVPLNATANLWVCYDGDSNGPNMTAGQGTQVAPGQTLQLNNDGIKNIFTHDIYAISDGPNITVSTNGN